MKTNTYRHYNNVLRKSIRNRVSRPCNNETLFLAFCLENQEEIESIKDYPLVTDYEYDVEPGKTNSGRGDLILTDGENNYLIVEVKFLSENSGKTARTRRKTQKNKVYEQALNYKEKFQKKFPKAKVDCITLTNEILFTNKELAERFSSFREQKKKLWKIREQNLYPVKIQGQIKK